jgi:2-methylcitrate dehydratase PrpD
LTDVLIDRLAFFVENDLSNEDKHQVRRCLIDYIGVTFAGSSTLKHKVDQYIADTESYGEYQSIGYSEKIQLTSAAFVNGLFSHVAELDDGDRYGMFHPGAPLFSALLPLMQRYNISSELFEKAVICGYEASMLIARTLQPYVKEKGFHGTGIAGTIGAAIACSVALEANRDELKASLSAACTSASGLLKVIKGNSQMKPLNVAYAAQNGLQAALIAKSGFVGSDDVLDGDLGFLKAFTDKLNLYVIETASKSSQPLIHSIYVKPYAACRHCHAPIEAALTLADDQQFSIDDIELVVVATYSWAITGHDHTEITGMNSAKMSIPYSVAAALLFKRGDIDVFGDFFTTNEEVLELTKKVKVTEDVILTKKAPGERGARVEIVRSKESKPKCEKEIHFVALPKGEPENPVTDGELIQKMKSLCSFASVDEQRIAKLSMILDYPVIDSLVLNKLLYSTI